MRTIYLLLFLSCSHLAISQSGACIDKTIAGGSINGESGVMDINSKWTNGATLRVKFLGGSAYVQQRIQHYAKMWENHANVKFDFVSFGEADIRIGFANTGYWSYAGTGARNISANEQTMNYQGFNDNTSETVFKRTVLHEFGHALGLLHEHKSPLSHIQWNVPKVYQYYMQGQGWSQKQVDEQVLNRYTVTMTNKEYDKFSIMHYPILPELTLDNYSVDWNTDLSAGDKKLIGEMYPFPGPKPVQPVTGGNTAASSVLNNISIEHNIFSNGKYGMRITGSFKIDNALNRKCSFAAYFYFANGAPLKDYNGQYASATGNVAIGKECVPIYTSSIFNNEQLFIPYDELHLNSGFHQLKILVSIWDDRSIELVQGGATYFTYRNGAQFTPIFNVNTFENQFGRMVIMPKFSVQGGRGINYQLVTYIHFGNGTPVQVFNPATQRMETLSFGMPFQPFYDNTTYNYGFYSDLFLYVPFNSFPVFGRRTFYKYFTAVFKDGVQVATSSWNDFFLDR